MNQQEMEDITTLIATYRHMVGVRDKRIEALEAQLKEANARPKVPGPGKGKRTPDQPDQECVS